MTRPFHLRDHFLPDYRAASRGDYLPTGIYLIYVHSFGFGRCSSPLSPTLLHIRQHGGGGGGGGGGGVPPQG